MLRGSSLQVKVTLAIVLSLLVIDGVGAAIAEYNFRESENANARAESKTRVTALSHVLDVRFHTLGQAASDAAEAMGEWDHSDIQQLLDRAGFTSYVGVAGADTVLFEGGDAAADPDLAKVLLAYAPPPQFPTRNILYVHDHLVVAIRSLNHKHSIVAAIDHATVSDSFLVDVLVESTAANVIVTKNGELLAASQTYPEGAPVQGLGAGETVQLDGESYLVERAPLTRVQGQVVHLVPESSIEARVDALVYRFVATSTAAIILAGVASVFIVAFAMRPLRRITDAARRLGRGEEDLDLDVRSHDEMGVLADVLNQSARAIGDARRAQEAHADQLRLAAEDFQVAVGALARSVGEADTSPEVARRLAEAAVLVTPARAVAVFLANDLLELRLASPEHGPGDLSESAVRALLESDADAFRWLSMPVDDTQLRIAVLCLPRGIMTDGDGRKLEILLNQAALALHRARSMEDLRRAHNELDELLRQKQVYLDILSHDLKNPIAVARGRAEMLRAKQPELSERLVPIEKSLDRATEIIEEAVLYSKLEREVELRMPEIDLAHLAKETVHGLGPLAAARGIELVVESPPAVPWRANHLLLRAVENLLSNAIKWSPERSTIVVGVDPRPDGTCRVRVVDHGPGIPPADRDKLFARFSRVDKSGIKGVGLGLAIAKRVVDMHRGRILIEDTPGGGCTFVIELPRVADAEPPAPVPSPSSVPREGPA